MKLSYVQSVYYGGQQVGINILVAFGIFELEKIKLLPPFYTTRPAKSVKLNHFFRLF